MRFTWAGLALLLASCTSPDAPPDLRAGAPADQFITLDIERGVAVAPEWQAKINDCSIGDVRCLDVEGHFLIAMTSKCAGAGSRFDLGELEGVFLRVAPTPHLAPPSGSFVSAKYPNALLFYGTVQGFTELLMVKHTPWEKEFDPNDYGPRQAIRTASGKPLFACN